MHLHLNRGKKSVVLDLKTAEAKQATSKSSSRSATS